MQDWKDTTKWLDAALDRHRMYRRKTLNLIASENVMSPAVASYYALDLGHRYGNYEGTDVHCRKYQGNRFLADLEEKALNDIRSMFHAQTADLRPLSGHVAGASVILGLCAPEDLVLELNSEAGGHRLAEKLCQARLIRLRIEPVPFDGVEFQVRVDETVNRIHRDQPRLVILGSSCYLFPTPIEEIAAACRACGTTLLMDASHVLGLIAGGVFPQPLDEGADLLISSTHKTLGGPQGGLLCGRSEAIVQDVIPALYPALITNHHLMRIPALIAVLAEWRCFGAAYARAIVENAMSLANELEALGTQVVRTAKGTTQSHTILIKTKGLGQSAKQIAQRMEDCGIIAGAAVLPAEQGGEGIRLGLQEITRLGLNKGHTRGLARLIRDSMTESDTQTVRQAVEGFSSEFQEFRYFVNHE